MGQQNACICVCVCVCFADASPPQQRPLQLAAAQTQHQMQRAVLLDVVVLQGLEPVCRLGKCVKGYVGRSVLGGCENVKETDGPTHTYTHEGLSSTRTELLPAEDEALLVGGDALLLRDLGLDLVDGVPLLHVHRDGLPVQRLDVDLSGRFDGPCGGIACQSMN